MKKYSLRKPVSANDMVSLREYPELVQHLLFHRGIKTPEDVDMFLNSDYKKHTHNPFLMKDMEKAVKRVLDAIDANEKIIIYSDYDADGIPGGVLLHDFFKKIGFTNFENYIPHRHDEGYGVHLEAVENFAKSGAKLLITVDCGIADVAEVARAEELGINVIVTDHHEPPKVSPPAYAILDPKRDGETYPYKFLCGSGVVWKLIQGILEKRSELLKPGAEKWLLDLVGLATLSDMVPLTGENRVLARYGLLVLRKTPRPGIVKLLRKLNISQRHLTEDDIGFMISPRINAASRMGHPQDAFELLATEDEARAGALASHLDAINSERKGVVASLVKEMKKTLAHRVQNGGVKNVIVLGNPDWRPSLLGLAANALIEEHGKPVFLWGREGGEYIKGSCRSEGMTDVVALMRATNGLFLEFGGHTMSGGFSVDSDRVHFLEKGLLEAYEILAEKGFAEEEEAFVDKNFSIDDVNWQTWNIIDKLSPFGMENPKPLFMFENIEVATMKQFGKEANHLELSFKNTSGKSIRAIAFFAKEDSFTLQPKVGGKINLVATFEKSMFRFTPELRLRIVQIY